MVYRKAILKAIESLHDVQLRSNVDSIRRHVKSSLEDEDHPWNEIVFNKTLKAVVHDGEIEQCTYVNCALSPEYKRKRANSLAAFADKKALVAEKEEEKEPPCLPPTIHCGAPHGVESPKSAPKRKFEHEKWKIMPKKIYDKTTYVAFLVHYILCSAASRVS